MPTGLNTENYVWNYVKPGNSGTIKKQNFFITFFFISMMAIGAVQKMEVNAQMTMNRPTVGRWIFQMNTLSMDTQQNPVKPGKTPIKPVKKIVKLGKT